MSFLFKSGAVSEAIAGLSSGRVDAAMLGYPASEVALKKGFPSAYGPGQERRWSVPYHGNRGSRIVAQRSKNREVALNFLRAFTDGLTLARTNAAISKKVLRKYTRVEDEAVLQATFEYYKQYFGDTLKVNERSYANLLQLLDHPKAKDADPKRFFDNSLLEQIRR